MEKEISFVLVELEVGTFHPLIKADFDELDHCYWVIDTGASKSVLDVEMSSHCQLSGDDQVMATGIGTEAVETNSGQLDRLVLDGIHFGSIQVALVSFEHVNREYSRFTPYRIIGLIGCDFLVRNRARIDFSRNVLVINT